MQQQQRRQSEAQGNLWLIKNRPFTTPLKGVEVTYSILNKKQKTFVLTHPRFLLLNGIESIAYASNAPADNALPIKDLADLKFKTTFPLTKIKSVNNNKENLIILFTEDNTKWEFECPSEKCAKDWKNKITSTLNVLKEMVELKFNSYADYLKYKQLNPTPTQNNGNNGFGNSPQGNNGFGNTPQGNNGFGNTPQGNNGFGNNAQGNNNFGNTPQGNNNFGNSPQGNNFQNQPPQNGSNQINLFGTPNNNQNNNNPNNNPNNNLPNNSNRPSSPQKTLHTPFNSQLQQSPSPKKSLFNGPVLYPGMFDIPQNVPKIPDNSGLERLVREMQSLRRNWVEEWLQGEQEQQLVLNFRAYTEKIAQILVLELPMKDRHFPTHEYTREFASYTLKDVHVELYFLTEDHLYAKHERYQQTLREFKNFDHLVSSTRNAGPLRAPLMTLFEYKGFLGMARTLIPNTTPSRNRELYELLDHRLFIEETRINTEVFLNESKCRIVRYEGRLPFHTNLPNQRVYFAEKLSEFLPTDVGPFAVNDINVLRSELVHDEDPVYLENVIFRDKRFDIGMGLFKELESKAQYFVEVIEEEDEYFTNSKELAELLHFYGLNMRHLGLVLRCATKPWIKRIIRSEIVARSLKNYLRLELQRSLLQSNGPRDAESRERLSVVNLLNAVFGNGDSTGRLWNNLNIYSKKYFDTTVWSGNFTDFNIHYLLQALQSNLNVVLHENIFNRQPFKSAQTFQDNDFVGFEFSTSIYDLDFTETFEFINEALHNETQESFHELCEMLTSTNRRNVVMLKVLEQHPIHLRIEQYLLNFTSPDQTYDIYRKAQASYRPNRLLYQAKLAEIKWYLKANRQSNITEAVSFFTEHVKRWLGDLHPLLTQVYRHLAEYFCDAKFNYEMAIESANASLSMQRSLFESDHHPCLWRDYFLIGKIHYLHGNFQESLKFLIRSKELVNPDTQKDYQVVCELFIMLAKCYKAAKLYKEALSTIYQFFQAIKQHTDEQSIEYIFGAAEMIQSLLELTQDYEALYRFLENDFSYVIALVVNHYDYLTKAIYLNTIPYLKALLLKGKNRAALFNVITEIAKIPQQQNSGYSYLVTKINAYKFPVEYLQLLRNIDAILEEIAHNELVSKWISYNKVAGQRLVAKIGDANINRSFEFLSYLSAIFNIFGSNVLNELALTQK